MDDSRSRRQTLLICLGLGLAVAAVYLPLWHCGFVDYDDGVYVTSNDIVKQGLTGPGIMWAFTTGHSSNWHPLTWISHMVDVQLYGLNPIGHHLTSLLLHIANTILLFLLLRRLTHALWPSALVSALFGLHPMHVESVVWISERKDVLSTLFWIMTLWAYVRYAEESHAGSPKSKIFYIWSIVLFGIGLMAKPMLVTLPFALLLFDYWPLRRIPPPPGRLLTEKIPFFILAAGSCVVTYLAQKHGNSVVSLNFLPFTTRLANVPVFYARYIEKNIWPTPLAPLYPMPTDWTGWQTSVASGFLILVTGWVVWHPDRRRYLAVGWLWFLGTLVPVIGFVQIGSQAIADRYDYIPSIGLFIMLVWAVRDSIPRLGRKIPSVLGAAAIVACLVLTPVQAAYWTNSETLFRHAVDTTKNNGIMENLLGKTLCGEGQLEEGLPHLYRAVDLSPDVGVFHYTLAKALLAKGDTPGALAQFELFSKLNRDDGLAEYNYGLVLMSSGLAHDAVAHFQKALELMPAMAESHYELGNAYYQMGQAGEAAGEYDKALQLRPDYPEAGAKEAWILATCPSTAIRDGAKAVTLASRADQLTGGQNPLIIGTLAAAYAEAGRFSEAIAAVERALQLPGNTSTSPTVRSLNAQLELYRSGQPIRDTEQPKPQR